MRLKAATARLPADLPRKKRSQLASVLQNPLRAPLKIDLFARCRSDVGQGLHPERHPRVHCRRRSGFRLHALLLLDCRSDREHRADHQHHHFVRRDVFHRHHVDPAGHRRHGAHHWHGGGRQRADLRTPARGTRQGQIPARRDCRRLCPRLRHHLRFARHHADFVRHSDLAGNGRNQGLRRHA